MVAQAILLSLAGVPGVYVHSLFGSRNWREGVEETGRLRTINRQKFQRAALEAELADPATIRYQVFHRFRALIRARAAEAAFHPSEDETAHSFYFTCNDIAATRAALERKGIHSKPVSDEGWGLLSSFDLPGGSRIGFYQPRHPTAF